VGKQFNSYSAGAAHPDASNSNFAGRAIFSSALAEPLSLEPLPLTHLPPTSPPHLRGRLPTVYPSASCSLVDRRRTWTRIDSRAHTQDHPPSASALDPIPSRLPFRDLTPSRPAPSTHLLAPLRSIADVRPDRLSCALRRTVSPSLPPAPLPRSSSHHTPHPFRP